MEVRSTHNEQSCVEGVKGERMPVERKKICGNESHAGRGWSARVEWVEEGGVGGEKKSAQKQPYRREKMIEKGKKIKERRNPSKRGRNNTLTHHLKTENSKKIPNTSKE